MQDLLAIAVAVGAAAWLVRRSLRRLLAPGCAASDSHPSGGGSFVPLDRLVATAARPPRQESR
jgi:hypothetical protein